MAKKGKKNTSTNHMPMDATQQQYQFSGHQGAMPGHQGMMPGHQGMMPGHQGVMPSHQGMMPNQQGAHMGGYPNMGAPQMQNQMMQMMQMMMAGNMGIAGADTAAQPFANMDIPEEEDLGLDADIIRPHQLRSVVKTQEPLPLYTVLDYLCLTEDGKFSLGGIPKGCTIAFVGPPGQGKTRTAISALCRIAFSGTRCAFVVAEEGFIDENDSGRDDLCSRLTKIGMKTLALSEAQFQKKVAKNIAVLLSQYHKGSSWDDFVTRYRFIVEKEGIKFVIIDSLNMLDPSKTKTADNLSALKTYNHEKGVTCLTIGQIRDTGMPVGGEALIHTADAVFLLEEMGLTSKEIAALWGGKYRDRIVTIRAIKSVTTPIFPHPIRICRDDERGVLIAHAEQPEIYKPFPTVEEAKKIQEQALEEQIPEEQIENLPQENESSPQSENVIEEQEKPPEASKKSREVDKPKKTTRKRKKTKDKSE
ncbi:ATPase domain-containing protein [Candidatus Uabimicrobium sp. HlEnr_7]|uniref:RAD55 family ATPase n=1 Tax=Candidatus Uabimicrobium helgolandensis TaxID=3095367 RepID=UPI003558088C